MVEKRQKLPSSVTRPVGASQVLKERCEANGVRPQSLIHCQNIKTLSSAFSVSFWLKGMNIAEYMDCRGNC